MNKSLRMGANSNILRSDSNVPCMDILALALYVLDDEEVVTDSS